MSYHYYSVLSSFRNRSLLAKKLDRIDLQCRAISFNLAVITMSSAYLIMWTPGLIPFLRGLAFLIVCSIPFKAMLHKLGDMIPPCGVP